MKSPVRPSRNLLLECLESRTLLAADLAQDFDLAAKALIGSAPFDASFSINFGNTQLVLSGHGDESLTVNLDLLPAFVTNLRIASFSSVTFTGTDRVDNLVVSDVGSIVAPNLSVTKSLHINNVASVDLASAGLIAVLNGKDMALSVRSLESTMIISDLHSLTLDSKSSALYVVGLNSEQSLNLKYRPDTISLAGLTAASVHMVDDLVIPPPAKSTAVESTPADAGSSTPPAPIEKPVVIITVPLDQRTRSFLAELRDVVRGTGKDTQHVVSEFMAHGIVPVANATPAPLRLPGLPADAIRPDFEFVRRHNELPSDGPGLSSEVSKGDVSTLPAHSSAPLEARESWSNFQVPFLKTPPTLTVDATWPVAIPAPVATDSTRPVLPVVRLESAREEIKLEDSVRAFGNYIVERVSAEFTPGEQSLILLVDPKPTRGGTSNPTSALESFARGSRNVVPSLRTA